MPNIAAANADNAFRFAEKVLVWRESSAAWLSSCTLGVTGTFMKVCIWLLLAFSCIVLQRWAFGAPHDELHALIGKSVEMRQTNRWLIITATNLTILDGTNREVRVFFPSTNIDKTLTRLTNLIMSAASPKIDKALTRQIAEVLMKCQTIKPGMTRAELSKVFTTEGGISTPEFKTYVYRGCPYIKVDVSFSVSDPKQKRPTDTIVKISKPYLEWSIGD